MALRLPFPHLPGQIADRNAQPRPRAGRRLTALLLGPLMVLLILWVWLFYAEGAVREGPNGATFGADFAMFVGAARVMQHGGNPYDRQLLYRTERTFLARQHLRILEKREVVRVGNPPLLFWLMRPLANLPFQAASLAWSLFLYGICGLGFLAVLRGLRWRRRWVPLLLFLLLPEVLFGPFYGNVTCLFFAALAFGLVLQRRYPFLAGTLYALGWLKPPVALPIILLVLVFHSVNRTRTAAGFAVGTVGFFLANLVATGPTSLVQWIHGLLGYSRDLGSSPDVVSFAGLYVRNIPGPTRTGIEMFSIAAALIVTVLAWHHYRSRGPVPLVTVGWLWVMWFLATPYAHFFDEILLAIPVAGLLGPDAVRLARRESVAALYLAFASLLVISAAPGGVQLLWIPLVALMLCLYVGGRRAAGELHLQPLA